MAEKGFGVKEINLIGASGTPTIESPNNLNLNAVNVAISTNATIGGNLTVSGTVGIAGTLTYEDVTNIDAIGIITARNGVNLTGGNLSLGDSGGSSDDRISIGAGGDINIYHNGTDSYVSNATGDLRLFSVGGSADDVLIRAQDDIELQPNNGQSGVKVIGTGAVELYHNNSKKLETSNSGATVTGTLAATAVTGDGSALTGIAVTEAPVTDYTISANGSSAYRFHGGGVDETANNPDLYLIRGQKYRFNNTTGSGHPFAIRVSNGGSAYTDGVSGSNQGIQFFTVPYAAPASLVYQCTIHGGMVGNIYIRGGSSTANISNNSNDRIITGGSGGNLNGEANLQFDGTNLFMSDELRHLGDPDTKIGFDTDTINFETGGDNRLYVSNSAIYVKTGYPLAFLASSGATPNIKSGGTNNQDLLLTTGSGNPTRIHITSNGRIGINDSDPQVAFHVQGANGAVSPSNYSVLDVAIEDNGESALGIIGNSYSSIYFGDAATVLNGGIVYNHSANSLEFRGSGNTARLKIDSSGNILLGSAITNGSGGVGLSIVWSGGLPYLQSNTNSTSRVHNYFQYNGTSVGTITTTTGQTFFNNLSDYRSKENDVKITDGIEKIKLLRPIRFNYKVDKDIICDGFFAHEVTPAVPTAVTGEKDAVDSEGNISSQMLDTGKIIPLLTAALQEAITEIETLKTKVAALEGS